MQNLLTRNLYFTCCLFALIGAIASYLFFYNDEVLSAELLDDGDVCTSVDAVEIVVDVGGAVENPGVFTLENGARLADLLHLAGGITSEVSRKWLSRNMNMAAILKDQQKIYVPFEWEVISSFPEYELKELALESKAPAATGSIPAAGESGGSGSSSSPEDSSGSASGEPGTGGQGSTDLINLNLATKKELETLPKVGDVTATKIIDFRPYTSFDDLQEKTGIYNSVIEAIKDLVTF